MPRDRWVTRTAAHSRRRAALACVGTLALVGTSIAYFLSGQAGLVVTALLLAAALLARKYAETWLDISAMQRRGASAEEAVGSVLDELVRDGYRVLHDLDHVMPGNVDHVVSGPTGVFLVETKSRGFQRHDLGRTKRAAQLVARELGVRWVTPVVCLHLRPDVEWTQEKVRVVGIDRLPGFIRSQTGRAADVDRLSLLAARG